MWNSWIRAAENYLVYQVFICCCCVTSVLLTFSCHFHHNVSTNWDLRSGKSGFSLFCAVSQQKVTTPSGKLHIHTHIDAQTHTFIHSVPSLECSPVWWGSNFERWWLCHWPWPCRECQPGSSLWARHDKHPLSDSALRASVYHTDTTEAEFCCTLLTSIVFQRQPPGGKLGKQLIHPHSVHKQTV